jgi:hypothetical protein
MASVLPATEFQSLGFTSDHLESVSAIKPGSIAFLREYSTEGGLGHKIVKIVQSLFECLYSWIGWGSYGEWLYMHAFVVLAVDDSKKELTIAEAVEQENRVRITTISLKDYLHDGRFLKVYCPTDESFSRQFHDTIALQIDPAKGVTLYSLPACMKSLLSASYGAHAKKSIAAAVADLIKEQPYTNSDGTRKTYMCSAMVAVSYQASKMIMFLKKQADFVELQKLSRDEIFYYILGELDNPDSKISRFLEQHPFCMMDGRRIQPCALEHRMAQISTPIPQFAS